MKIFAVLALTLLSFAAFADAEKTILEYSFASSDMASRFVVKASGAVEHVETKAGQTRQIDSAKLGKADLDLLKEYIGQAVDGELKTLDCSQAPNSAYGTFKVYHGDKMAVIRSTTSAGSQPCTVTQNNSQATKALEFFVNLFVDTKLKALN